MLSLGLTSAERSAFHDALRSSHTRATYVTLTDLEGNTIADLSSRFLSGEVTVDADAEVTRALTMELLDPAHTLNVDTASPDDGALYADRMLRVHVSIRSAEGVRYTVPVFHGPIVKLDRSDDVVNVEAMGKESLASGALWSPLSLRKGMKVRAAIKVLLRDRAGETRFSMPDNPGRLPATISLGRLANAWQQALKIAASEDKHLFYDARGVAVLRDYPTRPVWTFRTGPGGDILSPVEVSYLLDDVANTVVVKGQTRRGEQVRAQAVASKGHPLSPQRLGRNGVDRYLVETIEDDAIRSTKAAKRKAKRVLDDRLRATVEVTLDALPIPHLEPADLVAATTEDGTFEFRLNRFTIPLGVSGAPVMSVGYLRKVSIRRKRIRG